jgi:calcineurin-like phosphoesterase family protein
MPRILFTSDTHFGHDNIIKHCARPFASAAAMDAALIANWNAAVAPDDTVWHLGDFSYKAAHAPADYLRQLNGHKHLLWGNHDSEQSRAAPGWASSQAYAEVTVEDTRLVLFHYSLKTWHRVARGALQLYGHSHGRMTGDRQSCDVGVDSWDFRPVSLAAIKARLDKLPPWVPVDHHGAA